MKYLEKVDAIENENENEESLADLESEESDKGTPLLRDSKDKRNSKEKKEDSFINKKQESCSTPNNSNKRDSLPTQNTNLKGDDYFTVEIASKNERLLDPLKKNEEKNVKSILIPSLNSEDHINKKENKMKSDHHLQVTSGVGWSSNLQEEEKKLVFDNVKSYAVFFPNDNIEEFIGKMYQYSLLKKSHRKKSYHALKMHADSTSNVISPILSRRKTLKKESPYFFPKVSNFGTKSTEKNMIMRSKGLKKNFDFSKSMEKIVFSLKSTARKMFTKLKF